MSKSLAYKHHIRALSRWPVDPLRPDCQFPIVMRKALEKRFPATTTEAKTVPGASENVANSALDERLELERANVLYALVENRFSRKYPIKGSLMTPKSNPNHYTNLIRELDEAPRSSWIDRTIKRWKGFLRFQ